jgi:hypothetical protein
MQQYGAQSSHPNNAVILEYSTFINPHLQFFSNRILRTFQPDGRKEITAALIVPVLLKF